MLRPEQQLLQECSSSATPLTHATLPASPSAIALLLGPASLSARLYIFQAVRIICLMVMPLADREVLPLMRMAGFSSLAPSLACPSPCASGRAL